MRSRCGAAAKAAGCARSDRTASAHAADPRTPRVRQPRAHGLRARTVHAPGGADQRCAGAAAQRRAHAASEGSVNTGAAPGARAGATARVLAERRAAGARGFTGRVLPEDEESAGLIFAQAFAGAMTTRPTRPTPLTSVVPHCLTSSAQSQRVTSGGTGGDVKRVPPRWQRSRCRAPALRQRTLVHAAAPHGVRRRWRARSASAPTQQQSAAAERGAAAAPADDAPRCSTAARRCHAGAAVSAAAPQRRDRIGSPGYASGGRLRELGRR